MSKADEAQARARERFEAAMQRITSGTRSFIDKCRANAGVELDELIDPEGDAVQAALVEGEVSTGAASLAQPIDLILFETWVLGHLGDRDELDLDVNTHQEIWFKLGAWVGETLKRRHGGSWLIGGDDPRAWRVGFSKIMLEIAPHAFAEKLLQSGQGLGKRLLAEIERLREQHEEAAEKAGGKLPDRYSGQHYARLHTVPLAQFMALDMQTLSSAWSKAPASQLVARVRKAGKDLPPQNQPIVDKMIEVLEKLDGEKPAGEQVTDRGLYEAVAQVLALKKITRPVAIDVLEKLALPVLHVGDPAAFPPLDEDDLASIRKGTDLFSVYIDIVPYSTQAAEDGFLGCFAPEELGTPYPDKQNLEVGRGDWLAINPKRLRDLFVKLDPKRLPDVFARFVKHVASQPDAPAVRQSDHDLAENITGVLTDLRSCVAAVGQGSALVFRLLPPPG